MKYNYVKNPSGFVQFKNEKELYRFLDAELFQEKPLNLFLNIKDPRLIIRQFEFAPGCFIDYAVFTRSHFIFLFEVKNWFVRIKDMEQLLKYYIHAIEQYGENRFSLTVIVGGIEKPRKQILEKLGIKILLTRTLVEEYEKRSGKTV